MTINWIFMKDPTDETRKLKADLTMYRKISETISIFNSVKIITRNIDVVVLGRELETKTLDFKFTG